MGMVLSHGYLVSSVFISDVLEHSRTIAQSATIVDILSSYGCRSIPKTSDELRRLVMGICRYNFHDKPMAAMRAMRKGIPCLELPFWSGHSVEDINYLYTSLCGSLQRVLSSLSEPNELDMNQTLVFEYLKQMWEETLSVIFRDSQLVLSITKSM